jgi:hypothetical protein
LVEEGKMKNADTIQILHRILEKFNVARRLLIDGKEIPADKKFQGVYDNLEKLVSLLEEEEDENNKDK